MNDRKPHARQAILTRQTSGPDLLPDGTYHAGRIVASCDAGRVVCYVDPNIGTLENHVAAAMLLTRKLGWDGDWIPGSIAPTRGFSRFVFVDSRSIGFNSTV